MSRIAGESGARFRLGGLGIDARSGEVERDGATLRLEPKVAAVLEALAERAGELVSKEELLDRVWPDAIVGDDSLWRCIAELRKLFDGVDVPGGRPAIETLPRRGYRLNLRPEPIGSTILPAALPLRVHRVPPVVAALVVACLAVVLLVLLAGPVRLPDPLAGLDSPDVPVTAADFRELGMRYYRDYDADGLARAATSLRHAIELDPADPESHAGLAAVLTARFHWVERDRGTLAEAGAAADRALELGPDSASAHRARGLVLQASGDLDAAERSFRQSLRLRPDDPFAIANLATVLAERGRLDEALRLQSGLEGSELPPRIRLANLGAYYAQIGDLAAARDALGRALRIEPFQPVSSSRLAMIEWAEGDSAAAIDRMEEVVEVHPECDACRELLARIELSAGRIQTAADAMARFGTDQPPLLQAAVARARGEEVATIVEPVLDAVQRQLDAGPPSWRPQLALAAANSLLDRRGEAIAALESARELGFRDATWLQIDPVFSTLRGDPRFDDLVTRLDVERADLRRRLGEAAGAP